MNEVERIQKVDSQSVTGEFEARFGSKCTLTQAVWEHHGHDEGWYPIAEPDGVLFAVSTHDVIDDVKICTKYGIPCNPIWDRRRDGKRLRRGLLRSFHQQGWNEYGVGCERLRYPNASPRRRPI